MKKHDDTSSKQNKSIADLNAMSKEELIREYQRLHEQLSEVSSKLNWYEEQYRLSRIRMYGKSSEAELGGQMSLFDLPLFNEAEALREPINIEPKPEDILSEASAPSRKKHRRSFIDRRLHDPKICRCRSFLQTREKL